MSDLCCLWKDEWNRNRFNKIVLIVNSLKNVKTKDFKQQE